MTDGSGIRTEKTGTGDPEGMTLYAELSFYLGDVEWRLQKFAQSDLVDHGELLLDDRCRFLIRAVSGDGAYVFFDEAVQLGEPEADVWTGPGGPAPCGDPRRPDGQIQDHRPHLR